MAKPRFFGHISQTVITITLIASCALTAFPGVEGEYQAVGILAQDAAQGSAAAEFHLAQAYSKGHGVEKNAEKARDLLVSSARKENTLAVTAYAKTLRENAANNPDFKEIASWNARAAALGDASAQYMLGVIVAENLAPGTGAEKPEEWFGKAAAGGYGPAMVKMGELHERQMEYADALKWYQKAFEAKQGKAALALADLTMLGHGTEQDTGKAFAFLKMAAEQGLAVAQYNLGRAYLSGKYGVRDPILAGVWFERAAAQGMISAAYALRYNRKQCLEAPTFDRTIVHSCYAALPLKDGAVDYTIAAFYDKGYGVRRDIQKRNVWLRASALHGHTPAINNILDIGLADVKANGGNAQDLYAWFLIYMEKAARSDVIPDKDYMAKAANLYHRMGPLEAMRAKRLSQHYRSGVFRECEAGNQPVFSQSQRLASIF